MSAEEIKRIKIYSTPSITATLLAIPIGETRSISVRFFKSNVVRSAITRLNRDGCMFTATEKGLIDEIQVTRLK